MNEIAEEIASYLGSAEMTDEEFLEHYGMPRRSGRYPWGSGEDPYQRGQDFLSRVYELKKKGWQETAENIEKEFGINSTVYRREKSIAKDERRMHLVATAKSLQKDGLGNSEIGRKMNLSESTVRSLLNQESESRMLQTRNTANFLKEQLKEKKMIDVGIDVEKDMPGGVKISREKMDTALYMLEREGYHVYNGRVPQPTNKNQMTTLKVLADKDIKHREIYEYDRIKTLNDYVTKDGGETFEKKFTYPSSLDSKRLKIRYADEPGSDGITGEQKDGIVELRRGVQDLSLNGSRYSQVRILVDGSHYIKGMAVYSDDMPDGVDVVFNTNKGKNKSKLECLKPIKDDPDNPFGSAIKDADQGGQYWYTDSNGKKKLGLINKRADEGDWSDWADTLPSQFLSKQPKELVSKQLNIAKANKQDEFAEIKSLTNTVIRKYYLKEFADSCDAAAVDLKAAALPGQKYHVIVPINAMGDTKIYAPKYEDGTKLALIRYPHGGLFEIPILTVDNKNKVARKILGSDAEDAVGITAKVAAQLSGADFDGDTVMCIPTHNGKVRIQNQKPLDGLKDFDPKFQYGTREEVDSKGVKHYFNGDREVKIMKNTNTQMGIISNLITDMTLSGGATDDELAAAVRHSMVVIDAEKHKLDYRKSYYDNNIAALQKKYQPKYNPDGTERDSGGGANTIISKSKGQHPVLKRKGEAHINVEYLSSGKKNPYYNPKKPKGSLIYVTAPDKDVYFADSTYDKKTRIKNIVTPGRKQWYTDAKTGEKKYGNKISYHMDDKKEVEKYEPVLQKNNKGEVFYTNKDGSIKYRTKYRTIDSTNMAETDDAMTLVSRNRNPKEILYAEYANSMKALANDARIELINTPNLKADPSAKKIYAKEVSSLQAKLNNALKNTVKERTANRLATVEIKNKKEANPDMKPEDLKKLAQRSLSKYREEVGAVSRRNRMITITDREWEAIQAGAISENKLSNLLRFTDPAVLREKAMPKANKTLSTSQINRMKAMSGSFTISQIAEKMGISPSTVSKYLKGEK